MPEQPDISDKTEERPDNQQVKERGNSVSGQVLLINGFPKQKSDQRHGDTTQHHVPTGLAVRTSAVRQPALKE